MPKTHVADIELGAWGARCRWRPSKAATKAASRGSPEPTTHAATTTAAWGCPIPCFSLSVLVRRNGREQFSALA